MLFHKLRVFVSSSMSELSPEREFIKSALQEQQIDAWVYEEDAGARPGSIRSTFLEEVQHADVYLGIFWNKYGEYTIDEYEHAIASGKDCLIYEKRTDIEQRDPRLTSFLERINKVETGHTIRWYNTTEELGTFVQQDLARLLAASYREPRIATNTTVPESPERRELLSLVTKVRDFWITGRLEEDIREEMFPRFEVSRQSDLLDLPAGYQQDTPGNASRLPAEGETIQDAFQKSSQFLLILGGPGSGKTVLMLKLLQGLLRKAERDPTSPIPVVVNLSSWGSSKQDLAEWIVDQISRLHLMRKDDCRRWLEEMRLLVLFDGLDELREDARPRFVDALNQYTKKYRLPGMVVCCRQQEYEALQVKLRLHGIVQIRPLSQEEVFDYIDRLEGSHETVKSILQKDPALMEMATAPLMLDIISRAYEGIDDDTQALYLAPSHEARRSHLFARYIERMFKRQANKRFPRERIEQWTGWLAYQLVRHEKKVFLIEEMQPSWLETRNQQLLYAINSRSLGGLLLGLVLGLIFWLFLNVYYDRQNPILIPIFVGLIAGITTGSLGGIIDNALFHRRSKLQKRLSRRPILHVGTYVLLLGTVTGLMASLIRASDGPIVGVLLGLAFGLYFGINSIRKEITTDISAIERLGWSASRGISRAKRGVVYGALCTALLGIAARFLLPYDELGFTLIQRIVDLIIYTILFGIGGGVFGGLVSFLFGGFTTVSTKKTALNQGTFLTLHNVLLLGLITGIPIGIIVGIMEGIGAGMGAALFLGLLIAVWYGGLDLIQHVILRFMLSIKGVFPFFYKNALNNVRSLTFLRRVGGGYMFMHSDLAAYFAESYIKKATELEQTPR